MKKTFTINDTHMRIIDTCINMKIYKRNTMKGPKYPIENERRTLVQPIFYMKRIRKE